MIINELETLETLKNDSKELDYSITDTELKEAVKKLKKNKKAASIDLSKPLYIVGMGKRSTAEPYG